jgi:hypothetical protein
MYHENVPGAAPGSSRNNSSGQLWPSLDTKREPKSPRMEGNSSSGAHPSSLRVPGGPPQPPSQNGGGGMRNGASSGSYNFSIPSPNFGPGPGLPPINRPGQGSQGGSNPTSASQTPLLNPSLPPSGSMLPPPPAGNIYGHGHSASHGTGHSHAHSGSYFDSGGWSRTQQSPSSSTLNLNGPSGASSTSAGPPSNERQTPTSSRNRSDSLSGTASSAPSGPGQWSL